MRNLDNELAQQDAAATRRAQAEDWRTTKPTKSAGLHPVFADILAAHGMPQGMSEADKVRAHVQAYLNTPESFPLVCMKATLEQQHDKQLARRFSDEPQAITGFGELA